MDIVIPDAALAVLVGPSGAGKSTFAARHFRPTEVASSDRCRALVSDREDDQRATPAAFRLLHAIVRERLKAKRVTVVDATNVLAASRSRLLEIAARYDRPAVAILFDLPLSICLERNAARAAGRLPERVIERQYERMKVSTGRLGAEGFQHVYMFPTIQSVSAARLVRGPGGVLTP